MKFYEVQKALEEGKKIRRKGMSKNEYFKLDTEIYSTLTIGTLVRVDCIPIRCINKYRLTDDDLFADDWEIIEDIPEVKLEYKPYFRCPTCDFDNTNFAYYKAGWTCKKCGQVVKLIEPGNKKSFEDTLKENGSPCQTIPNCISLNDAVKTADEILGSCKKRRR